MRTITKEVFTFDELSESAKEVARDWYRAGVEYGWTAESADSLEKFCEEFGVRLKSYDVDTLDFETDADNSHFRGRKLREFSRDAMPTGYCLDCDLWVMFCDTFKATGDAKQAFNDALYAALKSWRDDMEAQYSECDECIIGNEYEFYEDGNRA